MALTLLQIVREHAGRQGLPVPAAVAGSTDGYARQAIGLLNEFCEDLNTRKLWEANTVEATWAATATESQGALATLAPRGYEGIVPGTVWDRTRKLRIEGGLSPEEWQFRKASQFTGPVTAFRIRGGQFLCNPIPSAGVTLAFEYYSSFFVYNAADVEYKSYWSKDGDTCTVDSALPVAYLKWAYKQSKGFDYAEDFARYERLLATKSARQDSPQTVAIDGCDSGSFHPRLVGAFGVITVP